MVTGDFDDTSSLDSAFQGASFIFSVTDYWQGFANPLLREKASAANESFGPFIREYEAQQNRNIIDAASKVSTLQRFVYSSLPNANKLSGGKYSHVYHFDGKALAEEYAASTYPKLWEKMNVFYGGLYLENYFAPAGTLLAPKLVCRLVDSLESQLTQY